MSEKNKKVNQNESEKINSDSSSSDSISDKKDAPISSEKNPKENNNNVSKLIDDNPIKQLRKKKEIIKKLRELVNGVEDKDTFNKVKELQNSWKEIGQVDNSKDKSLWTTYNALLDRFYDNRGIYFELKDLDRKKNL